MAEIVKIKKDGVIQYPITKPECVIDENGKNVLQLIREGSSSYDDTEVKNELLRLEEEKADKSELTELSEKVENLPTPDWNASEEEVGFIKNRTHYINKYITVRSGNNPLPNFEGQKYFLYSLDNKIYTLDTAIGTNVGSGDIQAVVRFNLSDMYVYVDPVGSKTQNVDVYGWLLEDEQYKQLDECYIPSTIARKSELTELLAEVSKKVDADFVNNAIAEAITTTLNTEV